MRERKHHKLDRRLSIQIPGLITGGFIEPAAPVLPGVDKATPHDLPLRVAALRDARLHYFDFGSGPAVVFVHGSFADYRAWFLQFPAFSTRCRFVTYSRRFHHPNAWTEDWRACSVQQHADDLADLIRELDLGPATLVGQSSGADVALHTALRHPELVRGLVLSEPFSLSLLCGSERGAALWRAYEQAYWVPAMRALDEGEVERSVAILCDSIMGPGTFESLPADVRPIVLDNGLPLRIEFQAPAYHSPLVRSDLARVTAPALLVEGDSSPAMFGAIADSLASGLPCVVRLRFDNVCHVPPFFAPDAFNHAVFDFLDTLPRPDRLS